MSFHAAAKPVLHCVLGYQVMMSFSGESWANQRNQLGIRPNFQLSLLRLSLGPDISHLSLFSFLEHPDAEGLVSMSTTLTVTTKGFLGSPPESMCPFEHPHPQYTDFTALLPVGKTRVWRHIQGLGHTKRQKKDVFFLSLKTIGELISRVLEPGNLGSNSGSAMTIESSFLKVKKRGRCN